MLQTVLGQVGDMLDWDGDIDLHVANEDFYRAPQGPRTTDAPAPVARGAWSGCSLRHQAGK